jgi:60 kDa SS-A/Ro ribonucleoprotein
VGLLAPLSAASSYVAERLVDAEQLKKARISPFQLLLALRTYAKGQGELGKLTWDPVPQIVAALDTAFDLSFKNVTPSKQRVLVALDVSGSMQSCRCTGSPVLRASEAGAAVASYFVRAEPNVHTVAFDTAPRALTITPRQRVDDIVNAVGQWGGGTDLAQPVLYALDKKLNVDAFVILTDNETWAGKEHCVDALQRYRLSINPKTKLVVMATSATGGAVCDPNDPLSLGIAGFDAAGPQLVLDFLRGDI